MDIKQAENFKHLGSVLSYEWNFDTEIRRCKGIEKYFFKMISDVYEQTEKKYSAEQ